MWQKQTENAVLPTLTVYSTYIFFPENQANGLGGNTSDFIREVPRLNLGPSVIRDKLFVVFLSGPADIHTCRDSDIKLGHDLLLRHFTFTIHYHLVRQITVAARSNAWTAFARSNTGIVGSNPIWAMDVSVRFFCVCAVLCSGSGLATGRSPFEESYNLCTGLRNWKSGQGPTKGSTVIDR
jgi:hypothetical protein